MKLTQLFLDGAPASTFPARVKARLPSLRAVGMGLAMAALSVGAAHAQTGETFTPDATAYSGTITNTGTFVTSMISTYAPKAILISVAIGGVGLIWGWARRAVGH